MPLPHMVADLPAWEVLSLPKPGLGEGADVAYTSYEARRRDGASPTLVSGCVAAPVPGWVEDMRRPVEHRGMNLLVVSGQIATGEPVGTEGVPGQEGLFTLWSDGKRVGTARLGLGFDDEPRVFTCWLVCANKDGNTGACDDVVRTARFDSGDPPPPPGVALSVVTWAVHHPRTAAPAAGAVVVVLGALAVVLRKKPRTRI